jgi:spectinomycin phosphotransferase
MLEPPKITEGTIAACVRAEYGIEARTILFLPLGADVHTAVYRIEAADGSSYFLKLRQGADAEKSVRLSAFLYDQGMAEVIPPLATGSGSSWALLDPFHLILYPFVDGLDGYRADLTDAHWRTFGSAVRRLHSIRLSTALMEIIPQETYSAHWRELTKFYLARLDHETWPEPVAAEAASFLREKREQILRLVRHTEQLAEALSRRHPDPVLCHADLHAGNLLVGANDRLYLVDWDTALLAPRERDLMYPGSGLLGNRRTPEQEQALFMEGYGDTWGTPDVLAYYRCERIVEDIAAYCEQLLGSDEGGADRPVSLEYLKSNFLPGHTLELAMLALIHRKSQ